MFARALGTMSASVPLMGVCVCRRYYWVRITSKAMLTHALTRTFSAFEMHSSTFIIFGRRVRHRLLAMTLIFLSSRSVCSTALQTLLRSSFPRSVREFELCFWNMTTRGVHPRQHASIVQPLSISHCAWIALTLQLPSSCQYGFSISRKQDIILFCICITIAPW